MKERNFEVMVFCNICGKKHTLKVNADDWKTYCKPNRPHVQAIFPYLSSKEREMLISGICPDCWDNLFLFSDDE